MKKWLSNLWENITDGSFAVMGCALMLFIFVGGLYLIVLLCKWLWSLDCIKSNLISFGSFIGEHADFFEYLFVGTFFLYLFITFSLWLYQCIKDGFNYSNAHDFFVRTKQLLIKIAKIIFVFVVVILFLFFTTGGFKSCSRININTEDYEHR